MFFPVITKSRCHPHPTYFHNWIHIETAQVRVGKGVGLGGRKTNLLDLISSDKINQSLMPQRLELHALA